MSKQFGDWKVMDTGEIRNDKAKIRIRPDRLKESDWWMKVYLQDDLPMDRSFFSAWVEACKILKIKECVVKLEL
jgi:hypothetical protein